MLCKCCSKETSNPSFCSRSCSAIVNNKLYNKKTVRDIASKSCNRCGKLSNDYQVREYCHSCKIFVYYEKVKLLPISVYFMKGNARVKYSSIRDWARTMMNRLDIPKVCKVCGLDIKEILECCHIKSILSFEETSLMGEVNSVDNLVWLCPNHHAMLDRGLLKLD